MSIVGLLGKKIAMTSIYTKDGSSVGATAIWVGPCTVTQIKTTLRDGYDAVQVGFGPVGSRIKPLRGHLSRSGGLFRYLAEFFAEDISEISVGAEITCDIFKADDTVKITGLTKGRGFSGGVKRYGFKGGPKTHGQSDRHRAPGSVGASAYPARVVPGHKMAGHYGVEKKTIRGLQVLMSDPERGLVVVKGGLPGHRNSVLRIETQQVKE